MYQIYQELTAPAYLITSPKWPSLILIPISVFSNIEADNFWKEQIFLILWSAYRAYTFSSHRISTFSSPIVFLLNPNGCKRFVFPGGSKAYTKHERTTKKNVWGHIRYGSGWGTYSMEIIPLFKFILSYYLQIVVLRQLISRRTSTIAIVSTSATLTSLFVRWAPTRSPMLCIG